MTSTNLIRITMIAASLLTCQPAHADTADDLMREAVRRTHEQQLRNQRDQQHQEMLDMQRQLLEQQRRQEQQRQFDRMWNK